MWYVVTRPANLLNQITTAAPGGTILYQATYSYNLNDQVSDVDISGVDGTGAPVALTWIYTYDAQDQLKSANEYHGGTPIASNTYNFDQMGNADWGNATSMNRYTTGPTGAALSYNARGDLTDDGTYSYGWDAADRLISEAPKSPTTGSVEETMGYDSSNRLIWQDLYSWTGSGWSTTAVSITKFVYDGGNLIATFSQDPSTGAVTIDKSFNWSPQTGQFLSEYVYATNKTYGAVLDANNDVVGLIDQSSGAVAESYTYLPFGQRTAGGPAADICPLGFASGYFDKVSGGWYFQNRWESSSLGRWSQLASRARKPCEYR